MLFASKVHWCGVLAGLIGSCRGSVCKHKSNRHRRDQSVRGQPFPCGTARNKHSTRCTLGFTRFPKTHRSVRISTICASRKLEAIELRDVLVWATSHAAQSCLTRSTLRSTSKSRRDHRTNGWTALTRTYVGAAKALVYRGDRPDGFALPRDYSELVVPACRSGPVIMLTGRIIIIVLPSATSQARFS